jgi:hypothetical protein
VRGGRGEDEERRRRNTIYESTTRMNDFKLSFKLNGCEGMNRIQMAHNTVQKTRQ